MSRIGKKSIIVPKEVTLTIEKNRIVKVVGSKGELSIKHHRDIAVDFNEQEKSVQTSCQRKTKETSALWGTTSRLIENMIRGVSQGFEKKLELNGVGFRMNLQGDNLVFALGFSHPVERKVPEGIRVEIKDNVLSVFGIDKQKVGQFSAEIRSLKPVEPYKGKGFRYVGEIVRRKEGKKSAS